LFSVAEPEPQRDAAPAPAPTASNQMFKIGRLSKISQTIKILYFSRSFACFKKVGLVFKFYPEPEPHQNDAAPQH
jgi:hypothetical protein